MRYAAIVEYSGHTYAGWQFQAHMLSVQQCLDEALSKLAATRIVTVCAGRTDAGVHGSHQVVHFDSATPRQDHAWLMGGNSLLPADIAIRWAGQVSSDFHARFSALARRYRYVILNRGGRPGLLAKRVTSVAEPLDEAAMQVAASYFLGEQDFSSVRAASCQAMTAWRNIHALSVSRQGEFIVVDIIANAFLHHMVRNIVGVLLAVGRGQQTPAWAQVLLKARDRRLAPATAAPDGLYLVGVRYPARFQLPCLSPGPFSL